MSIPPPAWPPPPDSQVPENGPATDTCTSWVLALGIGSLAGNCLLPFTLWILGLFAYGTGRTIPFVIVGVVLILLVFCSGPAAWILGNQALATGPAVPLQTGRIKIGRTCGMVGTGLSVLVTIIVIVFCIAARVKP